ncbi:MAG: PQQ-like beta-propeller repeat protein, partial [Candidatus Obscuribacterales bacterium]|nr:PQQ-like beta-propeller repeat protein [Candidatus Obscuribacterales bacterium]
MRDHPPNIPLACLFLIWIALVCPLTSCSSKNGGDQIKWIFKAPRDIPWSGYGSATPPKIKDNIAVYGGGYFWQNQVYLFAVDVKTGGLLWKTEEPTDQYFIVGDKVVSTSKDGLTKIIPGKKRPAYVRSYDLKTGKPDWQLEAETSMHPLRIISVGRFVYCWIPEQSLFALDPKDGAVAWQVSEDSQKLNMGAAYIIGDGDRLFAAVPKNYVQVIDGKKGYTQYLISLTAMPSEPLKEMTVKDDLLFLYNASGNLATVSLADRKIKSQNQAGAIDTPLFRSGDLLLFGTTMKTMKNDDASILCAFDLNRKQLIFAHDTGANITGIPIVEDTRIYFGTSYGDGKFYAIDKKSEKTLFAVSTGPVLGSAIIDKNIIYVNAEKALFAIDKKNGTILFKVSPEQYKPVGDPVIDGDVVYMVAQDSNLYAIKAGLQGGM